MEKYVFEGGIELPYISSRQNPRVVEAAKLAEKKHREKSGVFLCEGIKLTLEAASWGRISEVYIRENEAPNYKEKLTFLLEKGASVYVLSSLAFDKITTEKSPQGIISTAFMHENEGEGAYDREGVIMLLDSVRDPGNLGTVIRSACALGGVTLATYSCADIYNPKTVRAAMGAIFKASIVTVCDPVAFVKEARKCGRRVLAAALEKDSLVLGKYEKRPDDVIIIGNEGHGISQQIICECDSSLMIPMEENTESLNAAVAASVILWEYARG